MLTKRPKLPASRMKSLRYRTKGEGEPCKQGETSTQSGCVPADLVRTRKDGENFGGAYGSTKVSSKPLSILTFVKSLENYDQKAVVMGNVLGGPKPAAPKVKKPEAPKPSQAKKPTAAQHTTKVEAPKPAPAAKPAAPAKPAAHEKQPAPAKPAPQAKGPEPAIAPKPEAPKPEAPKPEAPKVGGPEAKLEDATPEQVAQRNAEVQAAKPTGQGGSYFADAPRDEQGHVLPKNEADRTGQGGPEAKLEDATPEQVAERNAEVTGKEKPTPEDMAAGKPEQEMPDSAITDEELQEREANEIAGELDRAEIEVEKRQQAFDKIQGLLEQAEADGQETITIGGKEISLDKARNLAQQQQALIERGQKRGEELKKQQATSQPAKTEPETPEQKTKRVAEVKQVLQDPQVVEENNTAAYPYSVEEVAAEQDWHSQYVNWAYGGGHVGPKDAGVAVRFITGLASPAMGEEYAQGVVENLQDRNPEFLDDLQPVVEALPEKTPAKGFWQSLMDDIAEGFKSGIERADIEQAIEKLQEDENEELRDALKERGYSNLKLGEKTSPEERAALKALADYLGTSNNPGEELPESIEELVDKYFPDKTLDKRIKQTVPEVVRELKKRGYDVDSLDRTELDALAQQYLEKQKTKHPGDEDSALPEVLNEQFPGVEVESTKESREKDEQAAKEAKEYAASPEGIKEAAVEQADALVQAIADGTSPPEAPWTKLVEQLTPADVLAWEAAYHDKQAGANVPIPKGGFEQLKRQVIGSNPERINKTKVEKVEMPEIEPEDRAIAKQSLKWAVAPIAKLTEQLDRVLKKIDDEGEYALDKNDQAILDAAAAKEELADRVPDSPDREDRVEWLKADAKRRAQQQEKAKHAMARNRFNETPEQRQARIDKAKKKQAARAPKQKAESERFWARQAAQQPNANDIAAGAPKAPTVKPKTQATAPTAKTPGDGKGIKEAFETLKGSWKGSMDDQVKESYRKTGKPPAVFMQGPEGNIFKHMLKNGLPDDADTFIAAQDTLREIYNQKLSLNDPKVGQVVDKIIKGMLEKQKEKPKAPTVKLLPVEPPKTFDWYARKVLPPYLPKSIVSYPIKAQGEPCQPGETTAKTGCVTQEGESAKQEGEEVEATETDDAPEEEKAGRPKDARGKAVTKKRINEALEDEDARRDLLRAAGPNRDKIIKLMAQQLEENLKKEAEEIANDLDYWQDEANEFNVSDAAEAAKANRELEKAGNPLRYVKTVPEDPPEYVNAADWEEDNPAPEEPLEPEEWTGEPEQTDYDPTQIYEEYIGNVNALFKIDTQAGLNRYQEILTENGIKKGEGETVGAGLKRAAEAATKLRYDADHDEWEAQEDAGGYENRLKDWKEEHAAWEKENTEWETERNGVEKVAKDWEKKYGKLWEEQYESPFGLKKASELDDWPGRKSATKIPPTKLKFLPSWKTKDLVPENVIKIKLPDFVQTEDYSCGAVAAFSICSYFGVGPETEQDFMVAMGSDPDEGTSPEAIAAKMQEWGLLVNVQEGMTVEQLKHNCDRGIPTLVVGQAWDDENPNQDYDRDDSGHYLIVIGYDGMGLYFEDSSLKGKRGFVEYADFERRWHDVGRGGKRYVRWGLAAWKPTEVEEIKTLALRQFTKSANRFLGQDMVREFRALLQRLSQMAGVAMPAMSDYQIAELIDRVVGISRGQKFMKIPASKLKAMSWHPESSGGVAVAPQQGSKRKRADQLVGGDVIEWRGGSRTVAVADHAGGGRIEIMFSDGGTATVSGGNVFEVTRNSYRKRLPKSMLAKSLRYRVKGEGEPCKQGETSTQSGCIPAEGDAKTPQHGQEEPKAENKEKLPTEPPYKPTMTDEKIGEDITAYKIKQQMVNVYLDEKATLDMPIGDQLRALEMQLSGQMKSDLKFTEGAYDIREKLQKKGIDPNKMSNADLFALLKAEGFLSPQGKNEITGYGTTAENVIKAATDEEKDKLIPYLAGRLADTDGQQHAYTYFKIDIEDLSNPAQKKMWADSIEDAAGDKPLVTKYDEEDGKNVIDYKSGLTVARTHAWRYTRNYDAFVSGMAWNWAMSGSGVAAQKVTNIITKKTQQNSGKSFYEHQGTFGREGSDFDDERVSAHVAQMQKNTQDFYKKKFGKKKAGSFDLSSKELTIYRGVGGAVETYMPAPAESWTAEARGTPQRFGKQMAKVVDQGTSRAHKAYTILQAKVTYADILFSYETMKDVPGWPPESRLKGKKEFVPYGGALRDIMAKVEYVS